MKKAISLFSLLAMTAVIVTLLTLLGPACSPCNSTAAQGEPGCIEENNPPPTSSSIPQAHENPKGSGASDTKTMSANGGTLRVGGVSVEVPAGAVPAGTVLTVTELATPAPIAVKAATPLYSFAPEGIVFAVPVTIRMSFSGSSNGANELSVYWSKLGDATKHEPIGTTFESGASGGGVAIAKVIHFSSGFVGAAGEAADGGGGGNACVPTACVPAASEGQICTLCSSPCDVGASLCMCAAARWSCASKAPQSTVQPVVFTPASGTYSSPLSVTLTTLTAGATIFYTTDGTNPTTASVAYTSPITIASTTTIRALATKPGQIASAVTSATYTITATPGTVQPVTFSPASGSYPSPGVAVVLTTATADATIYFTIDGTDPTTASTVYSGTAINIATTTTIRAFATHAGDLASNITTASYTIAPPGTVSAVTFTPASGTYPSPSLNVGLTTATAGATIYFTIDGTDPTTASTVYSAPFNITTTTTVRAFATKNGELPSAITSATYTIAAPNTVTPVFFTPLAGTYPYPGINVTLASTTPGATIYFTTNGTDPTTLSTVYSGAINLTTTTTIRAFATKAGEISSVVSVATYTIPPPGQTQLVVFTPLAGIYPYPGVDVTLASATPGATIYFTTDGSNPTTASTIYSGVLMLSTTTTIKAFATHVGDLPSAVSVATYTIPPPGQTQVVSFGPLAGTFPYPGLDVTLTTGTAGAIIYFTTNGLDPTTSSTVYSGPINLTSTTTLRAFATHVGDLPSPVSVATYTILPQPEVEPVVFTPNPGVYGSPQSVTFTTATPGATFYYTLDGSDPTPASLLYMNPVTIPVTTTIKAIATAPGYLSSPITTGLFTIN